MTKHCFMLVLPLQLAWRLVLFQWVMARFLPEAFEEAFLFLLRGWLNVSCWWKKRKEWLIRCAIPFTSRFHLDCNKSILLEEFRDVLVAKRDKWNWPSDLMENDRHEWIMFPMTHCMMEEVCQAGTFIQVTPRTTLEGIRLEMAAIEKNFGWENLTQFSETFLLKHQNMTSALSWVLVDSTYLWLRNSTQQGFAISMPFGFCSDSHQI